MGSSDTIGSAFHDFIHQEGGAAMRMYMLNVSGAQLFIYIIHITALHEFHRAVLFF
jgi:hypothetical protein